MEAAKNLRRPSNWPDFESLCKKLWGEIWSCPEIKKNGRNGQAQHGVDVYGMPVGEDKYYGIQCKGKDEYINGQFTEGEIVAEIEKAKLFQPALKKFYFATTAVKDAKIEEFVRKKNIENKAAGLFEIHIFSWEDIVELIDENKQTHDWYVKSQNFKTNKNVSVTFQKGLKELTLTPRYLKKITNYRQKTPPSAINSNNRIAALLKYQDQLSTLGIITRPMSETKVNLSYCQLYFLIHNTGLDPIEEYKMSFEFIGGVQDLKKTNEEHTGLRIPNPTHYITNIVLWTDTMSGKVVPRSPILVGDDVFASDDIFLKPLPKEYEISVKWKLISKDLRDEGILKLIIKPIIETKYKEVIVEDPLQVKTVEEKILEDVIINKEEEY